MEQDTEQGLLRLIAQDMLEIPISSLSGKLKRAKPKTAAKIYIPVGETFVGERAYGRVENEELMKARGMREGIRVYCEKFPQQGKILNGIIEEERVKKETHLYFGLNEGRRTSSTAYMQVMQDLGFTETQAANMYSTLLDASHRIIAKRGNPERSIIIG